MLSLHSHVILLIIVIMLNTQALDVLTVSQLRVFAASHKNGSGYKALRLSRYTVQELAIYATHRAGMFSHVERGNGADAAFYGRICEDIRQSLKG